MAQIFRRLVGLETEYSIRFRSKDRAKPSPGKFRLYQSLVAELRQRVPVVPAKHFKEGVFAAYGGAIWFESEMPSAGGGLIEGATPECRGPRQAITYQRAQDALLAECAECTQQDGDFRLVKNNRDAKGNVFGSQENYDVEVAKGFRLLAWRAGLVLLFPLAVFTWLAILSSIVVTLFYFLMAGMIFIPARWFAKDSRALGMLLFGPDLLEGREPCLHIPVWLEAILQRVTRVITFPLATGLYLLIRACVFSRVRRQLLPFLVSRPIISGCGMIDDQGQFHLADKAMAVNCVVGYGGLICDRPIFNMGHLFKTAYAESWFIPKNYIDLFSHRQRLQISLGDSNMAEVAEFLRVGTTLLVIDAIEAGAVPTVPQLRHPIASLHQICSDVTLRETVRTERAAWSALELQRLYWSYCRDFVESSPNAPGEAKSVLRLWNEVLSGLETLRDEGVAPHSLTGMIDWVTKKMLLDQLSESATWSERKKVDIRYHELSSDGYFSRIVKAGVARTLIDPVSLDRAKRTPPPDSPATIRGHYIREFGCGDEPLMANWKRIILGRGRKARAIPLQFDHDSDESPVRPVRTDRASRESF